VRVRRPRAFPITVLLTAAALAALFVPATAGAAPTSKPYEIAICPDPCLPPPPAPAPPARVPAGVTKNTFTVTLTNRTGTQLLGSSNITIPSAFTITDEPALDRPSPAGVSRSGNLLMLRDLSLPPNASVTVTLGLRMTCVAGTYTLSIETKQTNDFNGPPGNTLGPLLGSRDTQVTGSCSLRFVPRPSPATVGGQPADAEMKTQIRADAFQPESSNLVSVEALDATGVRLGWFTGPISIQLAPTTPGNLTADPNPVMATDGVASFPGLSISASGIYRLRATTTASGVTGTNSDAFQIIEVTEPCNPGQCRAQLSGKQSTSTVDGATGTDTGLLLLSLNLGPEPVCAGYTPPTTEWYEFRLFSVSRDMTVFATYSKAAMKTVAGPSSLEICFASPHSFITKSGLQGQPFDYDGDAANGAEGFVGLLPNCSALSNPCVDKRGGLNGGAIVTFLVPSAWSDPRYH
jgi:hypothetical protein